MPAIAMPKPDPVDVGWMLMELKLCAGYHYFAYYLGDSGDGYALVETKDYIGFSRACAIITDHGGRIIESKANIEGTGRGFIIGIYHFVSRQHLDRYLSEFTFRYNTRALEEHQRFNLLLGSVQGHLTYKQLIGHANE